MAELIETARLALRPLDRADAPEIARLIGDFEVARWLTVVPHPYSLSDAETFIKDIAGPWDHAITRDGQLMGVIGIGKSLGYWLGCPFWGQGYMGEASQAIVNAWFCAGNETLHSGYFRGNARSGAVLEKLGFVPTVIEKVHSLAQAQDVDMQQMRLVHSDWRAGHG
jgi:RimJ/RimL family protein N-acetyltransferase